MGLSFVLYRSVATFKLTQKAVLEIVLKSIRNNASDNLTGFLHTYQGHFLQFLEGPSDALSNRLAKIQRDRRHKNFIILAEGAIDERFFPNWDMGQIAPEHLPTEGPFAELDWLRPDPDVDALPLLHAFTAHAGQRGAVDISKAD